MNIKFSFSINIYLTQFLFSSSVSNSNVDSNSDSNTDSGCIFLNAESSIFLNVESSFDLTSDLNSDSVNIDSFLKTYCNNLESFSSSAKFVVSVIIYICIIFLYVLYIYFQFLFSIFIDISL